jgi:c-di-AMP phosphodiesterase-like protein
MKEQNLKNHPRYIFSFHIITFAILIAILVISIILLVSTGINLQTVFSFLVAVSLVLLFAFVRQFATKNQDRIIRSEENARSFKLTGKELDIRLTKSQVIALRFADDSEYISLVKKAINENLSPKAIKQAINKWRVDNHRV